MTSSRRETSGSSRAISGRSARSLIYLENQFLWAPQIVEVLLEKLRHPPSEEFRLVILLPAKPSNGADDTRGQLGLLHRGRQRRRATPGRHSLKSNRRAVGPALCPRQGGIVDDAWITVGSANLNEHSLFNDSKMNVVSCDPALPAAPPRRSASGFGGSRSVIESR